MTHKFPPKRSRRAIPFKDRRILLITDARVPANLTVSEMIDNWKKSGVVTYTPADDLKPKVIVHSRKRTGKRVRRRKPFVKKCIAKAPDNIIFSNVSKEIWDAFEKYARQVCSFPFS